MPEVQDPPRIRSCGFSGATCRTKLLPHSVFRTREHPQSSGGARGGKARLESDHAVFRRFRAGQIYCRTPYSAQGNIHRAVGVPEVQDLPRIGFCGFLRRNAPNKASAALRISHKGTSTEQQECPRCKTRLESNYAVFQAQCAEQSFYRAPYFTAREHPQSSGGARGGKARLELNSAVLSGAMCRKKLLPRSVFRTREHPQSSGGARGGKARLELDYAVFQAQSA